MTAIATDKGQRDARQRAQARQTVEYVASKTGTFRMPVAEVEAVGAKIIPHKDFGKQWREWGIRFGGTPATHEDMLGI